jgi:hypothetical protein
MAQTLITGFNINMEYRRVGFVVTVLVFSVMGSLFSSTSADEECATDFFSPKTCRLFDTLDRGQRDNFEAEQSAVGDAFWDNDSGFLGSQIWYRNRFDDNSTSMKPRSWEVLGNPAIHQVLCLTDLFGSVVCNRNQLLSEMPQNMNSPDQ